MPSNSYSDTLILNVDDNDGARYAKSRILVHAGFRVIEASTGNEALIKATNEHPALILLDVKLPDINGLEVCRQLKTNSATHTILVLQTSASFTGTADKIRGLDGGADNYLAEPIEPDELIANVNALLRLGKVERELREVDRRKDEFLATLGHELRNPLAPILNSIELWYALDPIVDSKYEKIRSTVKRQTKHLVHLVDDLLDAARIAQGKISLKWEPVELQTFINNAIEASTHAIENRQHHLTVSLPPQAIWIRGDQVRLSQIISNLLLNAAKFTNPGGEIHLSATIDNQRIVIHVADNGIGIAETSTSTIFELFTQSGQMSDRVREGLGIGLSLVRTLVELHGGTVKASSAGVGRGSTFEISLPIATIEDCPSTALTTTQHATMKRVMIVDDNTDVADTMAELLSIAGHQIHVAYSGKQAIDSIVEFKPDIVLLDIGLPDASGFDVAKKLRAIPYLQKFLLIAVTGYGQTALKESFSDAGFDNYFAKPMSFDKLESIGLRL